eukprot:30628-Pelagococcus_subviridis.AAC.8
MPSSIEVIFLSSTTTGTFAASASSSPSSSSSRNRASPAFRSAFASFSSRSSSSRSFARASIIRRTCLSTIVSSPVCFAILREDDQRIAEKFCSRASI